MIRMLIIGFGFAIRSERQICREVQINLAYRGFCDLGPEDAIPDHSAFSRARNERFRESDIFLRMCERVVGSCIETGLVGGEGFAVDASLIEADANRQRSILRATAPQQVQQRVRSISDDTAGDGRGHHDQRL
jgi:transposase